jgi:hypothetical protein
LINIDLLNKSEKFSFRPKIFTIKIKQNSKSQSKWSFNEENKCEESEVNPNLVHIVILPRIENSNNFNYAYKYYGIN